MTERMDALEDATPVVKCTGCLDCWCGKVEHIFRMGDIRCMSPFEMLIEGGDDLSEHDKAYLSNLARFNFEEA